MKIEIDRRTTTGLTGTVTASGTRLRPPRDFVLEHRRVRRPAAHHGEDR